MPELIEGIQLSDKISVPSQRTLTDAGQLIVPCAFARTGIQIYTAKSLGLVDEKPEALIKVHRESVDVFDSNSMATFRSSPVTIGHPKDSDGKAITVSAENAKDLQVGMLEGMPVQDEELMTGTLVITNQEAIDSIESGTQELSAGYSCDLEIIDGLYYQRNIKANHIAIVEKGRAGSNCAIADEEDPVVEEKVPKKPAKKAEPKKAEPKANKIVLGSESTNEPGIDLSDPPVPTDKILESKAKSTYTKHVVDHLVQMMDDSVALEAAEYVAMYEENETARMEDEAQWYADMAVKLKARAEAHAQLTEAAHKIAKKLGKSMKDESDIVEAVQLILDESEALKLQVDELADLDDAKIEERTNVILSAKELTDLSDFKGKTVLEIKKAVLDSADVEYAERTDAYIEARFDVLCEDSSEETPMTKLQRKAVLDAKPVPYVNPVAEARKKMVEAQTQQHKGH